MDAKSLDVMAAIMMEKSREMQDDDLLPLDDEGRALAGQKRKTFDLPTNAVKVDPLR